MIKSLNMSKRIDNYYETMEYIYGEYDFAKGVFYPYDSSSCTKLNAIKFKKSESISRI